MLNKVSERFQTQFSTGMIFIPDYVEVHAFVSPHARYQGSNKDIRVMGIDIESMQQGKVGKVIWHESGHMKVSFENIQSQRNTGFDVVFWTQDGSTTIWINIREDISMCLV